MNSKKYSIFCLLLFTTYSFLYADSLRLKNGELLQGDLISYTPQSVVFSIENREAFLFSTKEIDFLELSTSTAVIQLTKKYLEAVSFELIGITSEALYLKEFDHLYSLQIRPQDQFFLSLLPGKKNVTIYNSNVEKLSSQELFSEILMFLNKKKIKDWISFKQFDLSTENILYYEFIWNTLREYLPEQQQNFLWHLLECYTKIEKEIDAVRSNQYDFPVTKEMLHHEFLLRLYGLIGKIDN